ncbi:hypothetical protein CZP2022_116 [Vibrio phage C-ZP2022]|nr:hypothetical protein CZP2022_116 [Vibrio phage C-ZP2022]
MFCKYTVRLHKEDKGLKPLPYVVWTEGSLLPRPKEIGPFDPTKSYKPDDVISLNAATLLFCKNTPKQGYARPELTTIAYPNPGFINDAQVITVKGKQFLLSSNNILSRRVEYQEVPPTSVGGGNLYVYAWDNTTGSLTLTHTLTHALEDIVAIHDRERVFITGAPGKLQTAKTEIYELTDAGVLEPYVEFAACDFLYYFSLGTRHFLVSGMHGQQEISIAQFNPLSKTVQSVSTYTIEDTERVMHVTTQVIAGNIYLTFARYDEYRRKTTMSTLLFDNVTKTLRFVDDYVVDDQVTHFAYREIDSRYYGILATKSNWLKLVKFDNGALSPVRDLTDQFDHKGTDTNIRGTVLNLSFFEEGDVLYMNVPVFRTSENNTDSLSVTFFWDAISETFVPFKGIVTQGPSQWSVFESDGVIYSVVCNYLTAGVTGTPSILGWDTLTKKFTTVLSEIVGGSIWDLRDWEELQTGTALVPKHNANMQYSPDMFVLDPSEEIVRHKKASSLGPYSEGNWEKISPRQVIKTMYFFPSFNLTYGKNLWSSGTIVHITY